MGNIGPRHVPQIIEVEVNGARARFALEDVGDHVLVNGLEQRYREPLAGRSSAEAARAAINRWSEVTILGNPE